MVAIIPEALRKAFASARPATEAQVNDALAAILTAQGPRLRLEHPAVPFALGHTTPDLGSEDARLVIEGKYVRAGTTPSKATQGISEDLTKYPGRWFKLFVIYDPDTKIADRGAFA